MITCIIVDDEEGGRLTLRNLIKEHLPELAVAAEASNVETAYTAIVRHKPDLIFLDIQLSGEIGFQLLEKFDQLDFQVIFITAYDKYALKAIKFAALDYLIKPVDIEELKQAVKKAGKIIGEARRNRNLEVFVQNMKHKEFASRKVALPILNGYTFVQVNDIIRCAGEASYSIVFLTNKDQIVISKVMKEVEELFSEGLFLRVHQSHLINTLYIKNYIKGEGGYVIMQDNSSVPVSRRKKELLLKYFNI